MSRDLEQVVIPAGFSPGSERFVMAIADTAEEERIMRRLEDISVMLVRRGHMALAMRCLEMCRDLADYQIGRIGVAQSMLKEPSAEHSAPSDPKRSE